MHYIAHIRHSDKQIQTVKEHLLEVKDLAEFHGAKLGVKHIAGLAGMLHDAGKSTQAFMTYLQEAVEHPESPPKRGSVDHSTAGGKLLFDLFHRENSSRYKGILAEIVGNAIISHHSYLHDFLNAELESDYLRRVQDKQLPEFESVRQYFYEHVMSESDFHHYVAMAAAELEAFYRKESVMTAEMKFMFLTKFIFSVLIDADRTNTRRFEEHEAQESDQDHARLFESYYEKLMAKIDALQSEIDGDNPINRLRSELSERCEQFAEKPPGIYTLSIPTGGGKTLASLRYALKHALLKGKKRIIYVVPYTTIIEQNAEEVRAILRDDANILEHHSNVVWEDMHDNDESEDGRMNAGQKLKLAKDNWDSPIIFTTMVQFMNVFYAKSSRDIRRLHHLSESVIIFDEVQKVPVSCVSLFNHALHFLKTYAQSSMVLCTATQPALDDVEHQLQLNTDAEMIEQLDDVIHAFKRVEIIDKATEETYSSEKLAAFVTEQSKEGQSILVILNTKLAVNRLYQLVKTEVSDVPIYHLSTSMCAAHRHQILREMRQRLAAKERIICISTQLIEAGVDISFDCVIRSLAGLDSIAQAAGRCNRHGKQPLQSVYVIDHEEEQLKHLREIAVGKKISKKLLTDLKLNPSHHGGHLLSREAMQWYFRGFYEEFESDLNYTIPTLQKNMIDLLAASPRNNTYFQAYTRQHQKRLPLFLANSYGTAAEHFRVIEDYTSAVLVPYEEGKEMIAELNGDRKIEDLTRWFRKAQKYTVSLFSYELERVANNDGLVRLLDGKIFALKEGAYSYEFGLDPGNESFTSLMI